MHSVTNLRRASTPTAATVAGTGSVPATLFRSGERCGRKCSRKNYNGNPHIKYRHDNPILHTDKRTDRCNVPLPATLICAAMGAAPLHGTPLKRRSGTIWSVSVSTSDEELLDVDAGPLEASRPDPDPVLRCPRDDPGESRADPE